MKKEDKSTIIEQIKASVGEYSHFYLVDIEGLNAEKTSELRKLCFKEDIRLVVVKNTLLEKALDALDTDFTPLYETLKGSTSILLSNTGNAPAKLIKSFSEKDKAGKPVLKAAYVEESFYVGADQLDALISIKSKNELIGDIIALLQSPAKNVISALQSGGNTIHGVLKTLAERN
ncbi:MAG: 50S ribosomal protein L10 [Prevotellaceae bacterium]|jgi:large subunit ribosomal protein L10|nr:50S ribosomal protein L10 [Prevotellaceae bacterium]